MDLSIIVTYRCNSHCSTCNIWKHPTRPGVEIGLDLLRKLPAGFDNLNITGGEPTLRSDLAEIAGVLRPKARTLEISSNGLFPQRLEAIVSRFPDIKIRFSLEGRAEVSDVIRGEKDGFAVKVAGMRRLKKLGGKDLGFAAVIQDENVADLPLLYDLCQEMGLELSTSALHNGFQFHKADNFPYDRRRVARGIEPLIVRMLKSNSLKNWFRAYMNLGLMEKIIGNERLIPCTAGTGFAFVDPWGDVYACNVRSDLHMGSLKSQTWEEIQRGEAALEVRRKVAGCPQNCWMVGSARTAMRHPLFTRLPRLKPLWWVLLNKARVMRNIPIPFERYVDFSMAGSHPAGTRRQPFLPGQREPIQPRDGSNYAAYGDFHNR
jgi:MoaA/NifB/PqqE/SkfB family radical SAM enzyme